MKGRLSPRHWTEIEVLWARGNHTLKELSEKYGPRVETISAKMKARGISKGQDSERVKEEFETAIEAKQRKFLEARADHIANTKEDLLKIIKTITYGVAKVYSDARSNNEPLGLHLNTIKAHKEAIAAVKVGREEMFEILGYNPSEIELEDLPELVVRGMTEQETQEIRDQQAKDKTEADELAGFDGVMPEFEDPEDSD